MSRFRLGWGGGQGRCEQRREVFLKIQKKVFLVGHEGVRMDVSAGPKGGPEGHVPPRRCHECPLKNNNFFHVLLKEKVGEAQMTDTGLQMMGFKIPCSLVTADTTLLYFSKQNSETKGGDLSPVQSCGAGR